MRRFQLLFIILAFLIMLFLAFRLLPFAFDDAYIHFRIARNLAQLGRPYFNPEDPVMATSSPVWTFILAIIALTGISLPPAIAFLNSICTVAGAVAWTRCLNLLGDNIKSWVKALFAAACIGVMVHSSVGLMETPLAMLLMALTVMFLSQHRPCGWIYFALAIFTRLELVVFLPVFAFVFLSGNLLQTAIPINAERRTQNDEEKPRRAVIPVLYFAIPFCVLVILTLAFWGTLIPNTVRAKQVVYDLSKSLVFRMVFFHIFPERILAKISPFYIIVSAIVIFLVAALSRIPWSKLLHEWRGRWIISVGAGGILIAAAYVMKDVFVHGWYAPLFVVPILFFFAVTASCHFLQKAVFAFLLITPFLTFMDYIAGAVYTPYYLNRGMGARVQRYLDVGEALRDVYPDARLMSSEIGALGYSFEGYVLDGLGLITPEALDHHPLEVGTQRSHGAMGEIPLNYVKEAEPGIIVTYPILAEEFGDPYIKDNYQKISVPAFSTRFQKRTREKSIYGSDHLDIYIREDTAEEEKVEKLEKLVVKNR